MESLGWMRPSLMGVWFEGWHFSRDLRGSKLGSPVSHLPTRFRHIYSASRVSCECWPFITSAVRSRCLTQ